MNEQELRRLFRLYINNELDEEEKKAFLRQMSDPLNEPLVQQLLQELWNEHYLANDTADEHSRLRINKVLQKISHEQPKVRSIRPWVIAVAASVLALLIPGWLVWTMRSGSLQEAEKTVITTAYGEHKKVTLPDSSIVHMNAGSELQYTAVFNKELREVEINGEVYFDIRPDASKPFTVRHHDIAVRVLGTAFNVQVADKEQSLRVVVESGRVQIANDSSVLVYSLSAGEELSYNIATHGYSVNKAKDLAVVFLWKDGILSFEDQSFAAVAADMEKWYGVRFHFENDVLKTSRFTGTFENLSVSQLLDLLQKTVPFSYTIKEKDIYITKRR